MARRPTLVEYFAEIPDPRVERARLHTLPDILALCLCATICGADGFVEIEEFGKAKKEWLGQWLELPNGIPSHDTLGRVFSRLNPESLQACFLRWVEALRQGVPTEPPDGDSVVALDGKTLRRSFDTATQTSAMHVVSAWALGSRLVLGQVKTSEKSNEITAIPTLLDLLDIARCVVTIDAIGCQKEIARRIRSKGADYVLALKGNQTYLFDDVKAYFADAKERDFQNRPASWHETRDYEHGRVEVRRYCACGEVDWLVGRDADGDWEGLCSIVMVESQRTLGSRTACTRRYYISSLPADAERIGKAIRGHWSIENQLHWSLDVSFNEDQCRVRKDHAPDNLAIVRHLALNLLQQETASKRGIKARRLKAGWDNEYLIKVLTG